MTDTKDKNKTSSTLTLKPSTLQLGKTIEAAQIRQSFAHGRSKTVTVEKIKTRSFKKDDSSSSQGRENKNAELKKALRLNELKNNTGLTEEEKNVRFEALKSAAKQAQEEEKIEAIREQERAEKDRIFAQEQALILEEEKNTIDESDVVSKPLDETKIIGEKAAPIIKSPSEDFKPYTKEISNVTEVKSKSLNVDDSANDAENSDKSAKKTLKGELKPSPGKSKWEEGRRNSGKISLSKPDDVRMRSYASIQRDRAKKLRRGQNEVREKISRELILPEIITVQELASRMAERTGDVIKELMRMGMIVTANQPIDADTAELIANSLGHKVKRVTESDVENILIDQEDDVLTLESRAPVVTIMGHVDHGKTSLLDALRSTDVAAKEAGGITQHIGAYQVKLANGSYITFLDTPGHEAFTAMRSRGAHATDIVVLVVAADDGIMAQTLEAINHAKAANVPIIVAINKIDKPGADANRVRTELLNNSLVPEEFGGDIITVEVSAKEKINLDKLEEVILLQAEMLDLKANINRNAAGVVIESKIDKGRGVVATILVQKGTLKIGDLVVAGASYGKVKAISNDKNIPISTATPSMPVEILGLSVPPVAGDSFGVVETEKQAREITEFRHKRDKNIRTASIRKGNLEELFLRSSLEGKNKELSIIIKADVQGSIEAIANSLTKLSNDEVKVRILHQAVGGITESDISLAQASSALILGFNVRATPNAKVLADAEAIDLRYYSIIYNLIDDVKAALTGMLSPIIREEYLGSVSIRQVFNITKIGKVAGSIVTQGIIKRGAKVRLLRDNVVIHEGKLKTLKRFKEDVKEVKEGFECGIAFENYEDIREKDTVEVFELIEEKQVL